MERLGGVRFSCSLAMNRFKKPPRYFGSSIIGSGSGVENCSSEEDDSLGLFRVLLSAAFDALKKLLAGLRAGSLGDQLESDNLLALGRRVFLS